MTKDRRATESPVAHLDGLNVKTDRRRDRRALTVEELRHLRTTTRQGPDRDGMSGEERALQGGSLARHSTITLTMDCYSHTLVGEQAEALDVLPDLSRPAAQQARATGTDPRGFL